MGEGPSGGAKQFDPLESFRGLRDVYLDAMAKTMVETVNSEGYAKATGAMLDATLSVSAPVREGLEKTMVQALQQLSLPSRQDVIVLAERFTNMEMRLDDMEAKLDRALQLLHEAAAGQTSAQSVRPDAGKAAAAAPQASTPGKPSSASRPEPKPAEGVVAQPPVKANSAPQQQQKTAPQQEKTAPQKQKKAQPQKKSARK